MAMISGLEAESAQQRYQRLMRARARTIFEQTDADARLRALFRVMPIEELRTTSGQLYFLKRDTDDGVVYRVFRNQVAAMVGEDVIGHCRVTKLLNGIAVITEAEVAKPFQRKGIASAVYDRIASDLESVGGLLWPVSPNRMTDAEFRIWWRKSPALVFYYPHRQRLGLDRRPEFEALVLEGRRSAMWEKVLVVWSGFRARWKAF